MGINQFYSRKIFSIGSIVVKQHNDYSARKKAPSQSEKKSQKNVYIKLNHDDDTRGDHLTNW